MYRTERRTIVRVLAAASLGLLLGTGLLLVLLTAATLLQGLPVSDLFLDLGRNPSREPSQAVLVFGKLLLLIYIVTCVGIALSIMRRSHKEEHKEERETPVSTSEMMCLKAELTGRISSGIAYVLGELSISHDQLEPVDSLRLRKAVELSRRAYDELKSIGGPAEFMALNNLVFYSAVEGDQAFASYILHEARRLKDAGQRQNSPNLLLTYCRAVLSFGNDPVERREVFMILTSLSGSPWCSEDVRREARLYLSAIEKLGSQV
jgi:hypothetical protein